MKQRIPILAACIFGAVVRAEILDGVAAIANDKVITYSEVREFVQPVVAQLRRNYSGNNLVDKVRAAQMDALNNLIDRALILQEFKEKGYSFPESVVDEQFNEIIANDFGGDRAAFIKTLQAENMTVSQYREQLRDRIIVQAMRNRKTSQEVVASPYKIETYYKGHQDDFKVEQQIKLRMIYIKKGPPAPPPVTEPTNTTEEASATGTNEPPAPPPPPAVDPRERMAEEILAKLDAGDSFESLAKIYSEGKEAKQGGDWGWISKDVLRKELGDVAFSLKAGDHSRIIDTAEGYYLLQVEAVKPLHTRPLAEVRDEIEKILLQQQRTKMQEAWVKQLRSKAYIRLY
jgi:parvulin-like peptidyl-prolyl isomerase